MLSHRCTTTCHPLGIPNRYHENIRFNDNFNLEFSEARWRKDFWRKYKISQLAIIVVNPTRISEEGFVELAARGDDEANKQILCIFSSFHSSDAQRRRHPLYLVELSSASFGCIIVMSWY